MKSIADIEEARLDEDTLSTNFGCLKPPLTFEQSLIESERCYFCYDAPCITACPTEINIPHFIRKIHSFNPLGAAHDILSENILGGTCARACPVETLCEEACVRTAQENKPVKISALQAYAVDKAIEGHHHFFERGTESGLTVAIVGAGPAGLACAHRLSMLGHKVIIFDAKAKGGGLNEYGLAAYKMVDDFAQRELDYLLAIGGIDLRFGFALGENLSLSQLNDEYDAVFLGLGLGGVNQLSIKHEFCDGVYDAVDYIADIRQSIDLSTLPVGRRVVVIGGGNTAIDIASQIKRLGAEEVTLVYRRGQGQMGATVHEQILAKTDGVSIRYFASPIAIHQQDGRLTAVDFERSQLDTEGNLCGTGETFHLPCDMLFKAIGQHFQTDSLHDSDNVRIRDGRIEVNADYQTSINSVFAGGDCIKRGEDLTVQAVQDGKLAAHCIDTFLKEKK